VSWNPEGWQPTGEQPEGWQPEGASTPSTFESRRDYYVKALRRTFYVRRTKMADDFLFDEVVKDPSASRKVRLKLYAIAVNQWAPNELVAAAEYVRPSVPNGFAYVASAEGTTAVREPRWPTTVDATVTDGAGL
jgi:hypothetical protein